MSLNITKSITLNTDNSKPVTRLVIKQGSIASVTLIIKINDKGGILVIPQGSTAIFNMLKPDGKPVSLDNENVLIVGNEIHVTVTEQMQTFAGDAACEVIIRSGTQAYASSTFTVTIESNVLNDKTINSTSEMKSLLNALVRVEASDLIAESAYTTATEAQTVLWDVQDALDQFDTDSQAALSQSATATQSANTAAGLANSKATLADQKATLADQKATLAGDKATLADQKATAAQTATTNAESKIADVEARFNQLTASQQQASEVIDARKGKASLKLKMDDIDASLAQKATKDELAAVASGSPKNTFATLSALQADATANTTDGKKYTYLVTADGKWYYWNGSAWTAGGTYQSTGIADGSVKYNNIESLLKALFSEIWTEQDLTFTAGSYLFRGTGALTADAAFKYGVISVIAGERYKISGTYRSNIAFYVVKDSSGTTLLAPPASDPGTLTTQTDVEITIPANGAYLYVNDIRGWQPSAIKPRVKKFTGYKMTGVTVNELESTLKANMQSEVETTLTPTFTTGKMVSVYSGAVSDFATIDYTSVAVKGGEKYHLTGSQYSAACLYAIKDDLGNILQVFPTASQTVKVENYTNYDITIPDTGAVLLFNDIHRWQASAVSPVIKKITYAVKNPAEKTVVDAINTRLASAEASIAAANIDVLYGKKLGTAGDSITEGAIDVDPTYGIKMTYGAITAKRHNMTFYNYGISGSTMQNVSGKNPFVVNRYQNLASDLDYLTIWFGWNDNAYGTLGAITDTVDTTFYGAYNIVMKYLLLNRPSLKIGLIVPYGASAGIRQAVRDLGKKWGVPYLDLYDPSKVPLFFGMDTVANSDVQSIIDAKKAAYLLDGTHPNAAGYQYLATIYENFLRSL